MQKETTDSISKDEGIKTQAMPEVVEDSKQSIKQTLMKNRKRVSGNDNYQSL